MLRQILDQLPRFEPSVSLSRRKRIFALDGLRGWAALCVVCFHLLWETFGKVDPIYRNFITAFMMDGRLAVSIFFVLSGEALSASYFSGRGPKAVIELAVRRYPRLVIPVLAASILTTTLVAAGLRYNIVAGQIVDREEWLGSWLQTPVSFGRLFRFSLYEVFTTISPQKSLIPFLWTMRIELIGSILTFFILLLCHRRRAGWPLVGVAFSVFMIFYLIVGDMTFGNLACFITGIVFAKLRFSGIFEHAHKSRFVNSASLIVIVVLLAVDSIMMAAGVHYSRAPVFAMILVLALFCNKQAAVFLSNRVSRFLGRISFPLFLVQFPVIISFTSWAIVRVNSSDQLTNLSFPIFVSSLIICLLLAVVFEPVEIFTKLCGKLLTKDLIPKARWLTHRGFPNRARDDSLGGMGVSHAVKLREEYSGEALRGLARRSRDATEGSLVLQSVVQIGSLPDD